MMARKRLLQWLRCWQLQPPASRARTRYRRGGGRPRRGCFILACFLQRLFLPGLFSTSLHLPRVLHERRRMISSTGGQKGAVRCEPGLGRKMGAGLFATLYVDSTDPFSNKLDSSFNLFEILLFGLLIWEAEPNPRVTNPDSTNVYSVFDSPHPQYDRILDP